MERNASKVTVLQPSASGKKQQKKTNVTAGKETGRPGIKPKDANEARKRARVLKGGKLRRIHRVVYQHCRGKPSGT